MTNLPEIRALKKDILTKEREAVMEGLQTIYSYLRANGSATPRKLAEISGLRPQEIYQQFEHKRSLDLRRTMHDVTHFYIECDEAGHALPDSRPQKITQRKICYSL